jgi:NAD(P)-dependent dehydrogenase (short-subunit alcohol dehydrogenase family)
MIKHALLAAFAATTTALKATVFGGNGYIGKAVCKALAAKGVAVTSVSRSGRPADREPWMEKVDWVAADAAKDSLSAALNGASACVSCVGGFTGAKASPTGTGDIPVLFASYSPQDQEEYRQKNGPPNEAIAKAAKEAGVGQYVLVGVAADAENGLAGGIPGYFEGKADALNAAVRNFGADAVVVCPHDVVEPGSARIKAVDNPFARFARDANKAIGSVGYRGEDLVTKLSLTPPSSVDDVAAVVAAAAAADLEIDVSTRTTRRVLLDTSDGIRTLDSSREYNVDARFVDGTDAIKAAAAGKVALWNSGV